ncbi:trigger factor [Candidatus Saccharibacteria bacterium]|nr:trigger factor [Candidatus Saccharibacteria bacterium]
MKTSVKKLSDTKIELTVKLDKSDLGSYRDKALARLAKELKVEGFRKGKAPLFLAEKRINPNDLNSTTLDLAVRMTVPLAFSEASKQPIVMPNVNVTKFVPDELVEYTATAEIIPEIELGDYKKLKVKKDKTEVKESDVTDILENIRAAYAEKKTAKKPAELGDEVIIDFVGKKDGKPFEGGSAKDHALLLGSKSFIPGFEEGLVGHSAGDKFNLDLTFPKDYPAKALAGAKTIFEILVKQVNEVKKPALDADFAKKCGPFKTIDELKADIKKNIENQNLARTLNKYKDDLVSELIKKSKVSAPDILVEDQLRLITDDFTRNARSRGQDLKAYIESTGEKFDKWQAEARELAVERVKASLILQTLAVKEKITVAEDEVDAKLSELKTAYKNSKEALENLKDPRVRADIKNRMTIDKTLEHLVKLNEK